nr:MAG TPA: hypothetical protein [Caudoviricetes sp.]
MSNNSIYKISMSISSSYIINSFCPYIFNVYYFLIIKSSIFL